MVKLNSFSGRIQSSSLLEVVVAMVIIMIVFGTAMMIFANVTRSSLSIKKLKAEAIINMTMAKIERNNEEVDQVLKIDAFNIEVVIKPQADVKDLKEVSITAYDENKEKILQVRKLIICYHEVSR